MAGIDRGRLYGRSIAFPPRLGPDGRLAFSEGEDNIRESIRVILSTEQRERTMLPEFGAGLGRYLFEPNTATTRQSVKDRIEKTLKQWEPRVALESVEVEADPADARAAIATITYKLVATQVRERIGVRVTLGG